MEVVLFKYLTYTDVNYKLEVPTGSLLLSDEILQGKHSMEFQAMGVLNGNPRVWCFRLSTRTKGYSKPSLARKGWLAFVRQKELQKGDEVTFYAGIDQATGEMIYQVNVRRMIVLLGKQVWANV